MRDYEHRILLAVLLLCAGAAHADDSDATWSLQMSPYTYHFHYNPEHKPVRLIGLERETRGGCVFGLPGDTMWGLDYFSNSFGQPSAYGYYGCNMKHIFGTEKWFFKWSAGVLYGYKPPYQNKVPFNRNGWSPGVVVSPGYQITPALSTQIDVLGNSALMLSFSYTLGK